MTSTEKTRKAGEIWAVGGGRGATGKTFLAAGLGTVMARKGRRAVLVDMDTGGAGLSALFGFNLPARSLADFFESNAVLADLAAPTEIPLLSLIAGDVAGLASEEISSSARQRFFRQLSGLDARNVIIDVGTGSRGLGLDAFLAADRMIIVLSPENPAVENVYRFVKSVLFRRIENSLRKYGLKEIVPRLWERRDRYGVRNIKDLIDYIKAAYPHFGTVLDRDLRPFRLHLVVNAIRAGEDIRLGPAAKNALTKYLGVPVVFAGSIGDDAAVRPAVREGKPFAADLLSPRTVREFEILAEHIARGGETEESSRPA